MCCATSGRSSTPSCARVRGVRATHAAPRLIPDAGEAPRPPRPADRRAAVTFAWASLARAAGYHGGHTGVKVLPASRLGCRRQRSCHHTHSAGARRMAASIAAVNRAVSAATAPRARAPVDGDALEGDQVATLGTAPDEHGDHRRARPQRQHRRRPAACARGARRTGRRRRRRGCPGRSGCATMRFARRAPRAPRRGSRGVVAQQDLHAALRRESARMSASKRSSFTRRATTVTPIAARRDGRGEQLPVADVAGDGERAASARRAPRRAPRRRSTARSPGRARASARAPARRTTRPACSEASRARARARAASSSSGKASRRRARARAGAASRGARARRGRAPDRRASAARHAASARSRAAPPPDRCARAARCAGRGWRAAAAARASAGAAATPARPRRHTTPARRRSCRWMTPAGRRVAVVEDEERRDRVPLHHRDRLRRERVAARSSSACGVIRSRAVRRADVARRARAPRRRSPSVTMPDQRRRRRRRPPSCRGASP